MFYVVICNTIQAYFIIYEWLIYLKSTVRELPCWFRHNVIWWASCIAVQSNHLACIAVQSSSAHSRFNELDVVGTSYINQSVMRYSPPINAQCSTAYRLINQSIKSKHYQSQQNTVNEVNAIGANEKHIIRHLSQLHWTKQTEPTAVHKASPHCSSTNMGRPAPTANTWFTQWLNRFE